MTALTELRKILVGGGPVPLGRAADHFESMFGKTPVDDLWSLVISAFDGSLDAAKALHEAVLGPDWSICITLGAALWDVDLTHYPYHDADRRKEWDVTAGPESDPARAWLLAILDALIAKEDRADG